MLPLVYCHWSIFYFNGSNCCCRHIQICWELTWMAWRKKTRKAKTRRVKQHSDGTVPYHHCNRLDPCSKQSPFLFELPLVFGFPCSRKLGCDQYFWLNWEHKVLSVDCCTVGVFTELRWNSFTLSCQLLLYLHCCLFCIIQVGSVKPVWGGNTGWTEMHRARSKARLEQESWWQMPSLIDKPQ